MTYSPDSLNSPCMKCQLTRNIPTDESPIKYDLSSMSVSNVKRIPLKFNHLVNSKKKIRQNNLHNVTECCLLHCVKICLIIHVPNNYFWRCLNVFGIFCSVIQESWEEAIMYVMPKTPTRNGIATMTVVVK